MVDKHLAGGQEAIKVHLLRREPEEKPRARVADGVVAEDEEPARGSPH